MASTGSGADGKTYPRTKTSWCTLTAEETEWAVTLRAEARARGLPSDLSDFKYAQFALVSKGNLAKGLARIEKWSSWQAKYGEAKVGGRDASYDFAERAFPGLLHAAQADSVGRSRVGFDYGKFDPTKVYEAKDWKQMVRLMTTLMDSLSADFDDIRTGSVFLLDVSELGWANFSADVERKMAGLYQDAYPIKIKRMVLLDSPFIIWAVLKVISLFLKQKLRDRIQMLTRPEFMSSEHFFKQGLSARFGGTHKTSFRQWSTERIKRRESLDDSFQLPKQAKPLKPLPSPSKPASPPPPVPAQRKGRTAPASA